MTQQVINIGASPNDTSGDPIRTAFTKVNANFTDLYTQISGLEFDAVIPSQTGNNGKYLTTNGSALSWGTINTTTNSLVNGSYTLTLGSNGTLTFPNSTTFNGSTFVMPSDGTFNVQIYDSTSSFTRTFTVGSESITLPTGNGNIISGTGTWNLDTANGQFTFPNYSRISYGTNNGGLGAYDLKVEAISGGSVQIESNSNIWTFGSSGSLKLPNGGVVSDSSTTVNIVSPTPLYTVTAITATWMAGIAVSPYTFSDTRTGLNFTATTNNTAQTVTVVVNNGGTFQNNVVPFVSINYAVLGIPGSGAFLFNLSYTATSGNPTFGFGVNSEGNVITLPGGADILVSQSPYFTGSNLSFSSYGGVGLSWGTGYAQGDNNNGFLIGLVGSSNPTWKFNSNGQLVFPDNTSQTTAYTGWPVLNATGSSGPTAISIGQGANTGSGGVSIGQQAGQNNPGSQGIAIGYNAGQLIQGNDAVAVGPFAGSTEQGTLSVAIGWNAGNNTQGNNSVAVGQASAQYSQGTSSVAIGSSAGYVNQGNNAVAIGSASGYQTQGANAVAIGNGAGNTNQPANTIILNATGSNLNGVGSQTNSFYVAPIRTDATPTNVLYYNTTTNEVTYGSVASPSSLVNGSYTLSLASNGDLLVPTSQYSTAQVFASTTNTTMCLGNSSHFIQVRGSDGALVFADYSVQTTAYTGGPVSATAFGVNQTSVATTKDGNWAFQILPVASQVKATAQIINKSSTNGVSAAWTITVYDGGTAYSYALAESVGNGASGIVAASGIYFQNVGDYAVMMFQDLVNHHLYRVTYAIATIANSSATGTVVIEQLV